MDGIVMRLNLGESIGSSDKKNRLSMKEEFSLFVFECSL